MLSIRSTRRRLTALGGVAALALAVVGGTAVAGHVTGGVKSYTGCLVSKDGVIIKIKEGNAPSSACSGGMVEVHFSGGDITKISVTGALTGGGDDGEVTIGLKPEFTLPSGCATGQVAKWNGSGWACAADNDTTYSAGTGLQLSGTELSIAPGYRLPQACSEGQVARRVSGTWTCGADSIGTRGVVGRLAFANVPKTGDLPEFVEIDELTLSAGTYLVMLTATAADDHPAPSGELTRDYGSGEVSVQCTLRGTVVAPHSTVDIGDPSGRFPAGQIVLTDVVRLDSAGSVKLLCLSWDGTDQLDDIRWTALKVGAVDEQ